MIRHSINVVKVKKAGPCAKFRAEVKASKTSIINRCIKISISNPFPLIAVRVRNARISAYRQKFIKANNTVAHLKHGKRGRIVGRSITDIANYSFVINRQ
jgi:hypothetical protein